MAHPTVVFLLPRPVSQRDYVRFGFAYLVSRGFRLVVFQVAELVGFPIEEQPAPAQNPFISHLIRNAAHFQQLIEETPPSAVYLALLAPDPSIIPILRVLEQNECRFILFYLGSLPTVPCQDNLSARIKHFVQKRLTLNWWKHQIKKRCCPSAFRFPIPTAIVVTGEKHLRQVYRDFGKLDDLKERIVLANSLDFDLYLEVRERPCPKNSRHIVFLDEYFPHHPDYRLLGIKGIDPDSYYPEICSIFDAFEKKFGLPIVIAAHPRSDYSPNDPRFARRRVVGGQTIHLIRNSRLVLAHGSTSIGLAVLFEKPVIQIMLPILRDSWWKPILDGFQEELHLLCLDTRDGYRISSMQEDCLTQFDSQAYDTFKRNHMSPNGAPHEPFWSIIANRIDEILLMAGKREAYRS